MAAAAEDRLLSKILGVTLQIQGTPREATLYLADLAQELIDEGVQDLLLSRQNIDRALMARLMLDPQDGLQRPFYYLLDSYSRASKELRAIAAYKDQQLVEALKATALQTQELIIFHGNLVLTLDLFPKTPEEESLGCRQILAAMDCKAGVSSAAEAAPMPAGFLESFAEQFEQESLPEIVSTLVGALNETLLRTSLMGDFQNPLQHLRLLASIPPIARVMTQLPNWAPEVKNGRDVQTKTVLGPAFGVSSLPDIDWHFGRMVNMTQPEPNVAMTLFRNAESRSAEVTQGLSSVRLTAQGLHITLWNIVEPILKQKATREAMLDFLALALEANKEHNKEMPDVSAASSRGFMLNLSAVLLRGCEPFLDPRSGKAWGRLDYRYVQQKSRLSFDEETRLHFSPEDQQSWQERVDSGAQAESLGNYSPHFICECYFMTAKALHMGYSRLFSHFSYLQRLLREVREAVELRRARLDQMSGMPPHVLNIATRDLEGVKEKEAGIMGALLCMQAQLMERQLTDSALSFYMLTAEWLLREASPSYKAGQQPDNPLPLEAPMCLRILPEYLVSDMVELLKYATNYPELSQSFTVESVKTTVLFLTTFMPAAAYINNIHLRAQLAVTLFWLLPPDQPHADHSFSRSRRQSLPGQQFAAILIETMPALHNSLLPNLLKIFVEVERTGRQNQFYEKFSIRLDLGQILLYLWNLDTYRRIWQQLAAEDDALYSRFNYFLETDATHTLDEALRYLEEEREYRKLGRDEQQQQTNLQNHMQRVQHLGFDLRFAGLMLMLINLTTEVIWQPWLQEQAVKRIAGTLNYFLKYLTGPERKRLSVKDDKNEINFDPKDLLRQIASIYVHLSWKDRESSFAQAIVSDRRSYYPRMFADALQVLDKHFLLPQDKLEEMRRLAHNTDLAVKVIEEEDAAEAEAPEEFFDPIMSEIMSDPVQLPSGTVMDRENIMRHLMSDATDPFSRLPLASEDLKPMPELKSRIQAWQAQNRRSSAT